MTDDEEPTKRDLLVIWRTIVTVAVFVGAVAGGVISAVVWNVEQDWRLKNLEAWKAEMTKEASPTK